VASEVVVAARWADQPSWWVGLQPAFPLSAVPDSIFRTQHPSAALAVEDREVAHRKPERSSLETSGPPLLDQGAIADLCIRERVDSHAESIA
jgi:hypothetical protein